MIALEWACLTVLGVLFVLVGVTVSKPSKASVVMFVCGVLILWLVGVWLTLEILK